MARRCTNPTKIKGLDIPLDMSICADVLSIHYDPEVWGPTDPNIFYPQRLLKIICSDFFIESNFLKFN